MGLIKEKAKRLGEFGYKSILKSVESMKNHYIIWGHKGYYLEELDEEIAADEFDDNEEISLDEE